MKEAHEGIEKLQTLWPVAFPAKPDLVKPLATGTIRQIADGAGWSRGYTRGVLHVWKARNAYCRAVLRFGSRFDLNGEPVDQTVEDSAREQARRVLAARKARIEAQNRKAAAERADIPAAFAKTGETSEAAQMVPAG
jgi:sRNA-binding protein